MTEPRHDEPAAPQHEDAARPAPTEAVRTGRGSGLRWFVALLVVALVVGATGATLFLMTGSSTPASVARYVPAGTVAYAEARLDLPGDQRQQVASFLSHFPGFTDQAIFDQKIDEALDRILGQGTDTKVSYTRDLKPWLGDSAAVAFTGVPSPQNGQAPAVLLVATKDAAKARAWLTANVGLENPTTTSQDGVEVVTGTEPNGNHELSWAVLGSVVLAGEPASVRSAIATKGAGGFASSDRYRAARAAVPGDQAAFLFFDTAALADSLKAFPGSGMQSLSPEQLAKVPAWMGAGVRFESDAVVVQAAIAPVAGAPATTNALSKLAPRLPADTIVAAEARSVGTYIRAFIDDLMADPNLKPQVEELEQQAQVAGGIESFISWLGDATVVVTGHGTSASGGLVVDVTDAKALDTKLAQLRNIVTFAGGSAGVTMKDETYGSATITTIDLGTFVAQPQMGAEAGSDVPHTIALTHHDGLLVLGLGDAFVKAVLDTKPGQSLADQPGYKAAIDRVGASNAGQLYVDLAAVMSLASSHVPASEKATFDREYKPYLAPFAALAAAGQAGQPTRSTTILIVQ